MQFLTYSILYSLGSKGLSPLFAYTHLIPGLITTATANPPYTKQ